MVTYFIGGMLGSVIASYTYQLGSWTAVCILGAATAATGLTLWGLLHRLIETRHPTPDPRSLRTPSTGLDDISETPAKWLSN
jgi:hypothetical protein